MIAPYPYAKSNYVSFKGTCYRCRLESLVLRSELALPNRLLDIAHVEPEEYDLLALVPVYESV